MTFNCINRLVDLLRQISQNESKSKILVFAATKRTVDYITDFINGNGFRAVSMHGDKSQNQRDMALNNFRSGRCSILVATDVAARGLGIFF